MLYQNLACLACLFNKHLLLSEPKKRQEKDLKKLRKVMKVTSQVKHPLKKVALKKNLMLNQLLLNQLLNLNQSQSQFMNQSKLLHKTN
jgi:uncharacterized membrane protein